jgi:2-isopropylmalate synthase
LGKHSGRHALKKRVEELGYPELTKEQLDSVYERFTTAADNKKGFTNEEIIEFIEAALEKAAQ